MPNVVDNQFSYIFKNFPILLNKLPQNIFTTIVIQIIYIGNNNYTITLYNLDGPVSTQTVTAQNLSTVTLRYYTLINPYGNVDVYNVITTTIDFNFMMGSINGLNTIDKVVPASNICFPAGTPILTDQGIVNIDQINTDLHSIDGQEIIGITKTVTLDKYLIGFKPNAVGLNIPTQPTLMSKDHKIMFKGQLVPAERFLKFSKDVVKVKYSGETLYNVLLAEHGLIGVNNMICETLHPDNVIAKLYRSTASQKYKNNIVYEINEALQTRDLPKYKALLNTFNTF